MIAETPAVIAPLRIGAAWYPEQWPESRWDKDLALMEQAHFNIVRIGEFAWSTEEPLEGHYSFAWLDRAIALAARHHIAVVIGTPTDAPPAWLTQRYPETLRVDEDGVRGAHGDRRQFNYANLLYRRFCAEIVRQLALRYGHNPNVIGWQIGNEYTDESFDPHTRALFQQFLRNKYKTLANLNQHWTTAYWSETYTAWSQIPMESSHGNPGLLLEHKHFVTAMWRSFQRNQIDVLRPLISSRQFITTNIGGLGWSDNWDHYAITADLDLASWDDYVGEGHLDAPKNAMLNDFVRGWKRQNFWVMETEPGSVNWSPVNNSLAPGETRALAWQTVGHGADAVLYWQWRSALNGQEQYHGAIVGPDGEPNPIYPEIQQIGAEFVKASSALAGTSPQADIALLHTYDSRWAIDFQLHTREYNQETVLQRFYTPLDRIAESTGHAIDIIDPLRSPLSSYKLLVTPSLNVIDDRLAQKLRAWVEAGGHLLLGPRSGMKDQFDALNPQRQPGSLVAALGAKVIQYYALDHTVKLMRPAKMGGAETPISGTANIWAEALAPSATNVQLDLVYADPAGWLDHQPAMVTRSLGKGTISYLGTLPDDEMLADILRHAALAAGIESNHPPPLGVEFCARESPDGRRRVLIVINHNSVSTPITIPAHYHNLLAQSATISVHTSLLATTTVALPPQGVAVLVPEE
ncbi:MAG TPA: beta-galactosidase [Acidobacteriaceae bacterium]|jgi:beta-galactosidase|nr:beta-galactosidase [Acidobacteriaceae bacterium]